MNENSEETMRVNYCVKRLTYTHRDFDNEFHENPMPPFTLSKVKNALGKIRLSTFGFELFPIFKSLMTYYTIRLFLMDVTTGITMAFFHLPQGMAYGSLAGLRPVNGLYTSFFPVLAYFFFATSRHNSIGTFSLASLLFSEPINRLTSIYFTPLHPNNSTSMSDEEYDFRLNISLTLALCVGILQIIMAFVQLGFLATYLSGPLISGFMCASGFHVLSSQFNLLFGINLPKVVVSTVISYFANFNQRWGVNVVGHIPSGLPAPVLPSFAYFSDLLPDIFVISFITFAINAGLVKTYATEFGYGVLDNQELLAMGISNTFGAFFKCHTACGALGRTAVVVTVGMASQIASLISCFIFILILFFIAPYLESLPRAVLGCIVCVALTNTFKKIFDLKRLWKVSKIDASIWLVSFVTTLAIDIIYGVAIGFIYSILTVVSRSQYGGRFLLGRAKNTDLYSELKRFEGLRELDGIKIIRYDGPVYFANIESFQKSVYHLSGVDPLKVKRHQNKGKSKRKTLSHLFKLRSTKNIETIEVNEEDARGKQLGDEVVVVKTKNPDSNDTLETPKTPLRFIILDASGWMFTDTVGLRGIKEIIKNYTELEIHVFVASLRPRLLEMFAASGLFAILPEENFFVSVHDAVLIAMADLHSTSIFDGASVIDKDEIGGFGKLPRRYSAPVRRRLTSQEVRSIMEADPDNNTDLSVLGEERAVVLRTD
ncbi:hypothetical protein Aperf_G00000064261 [Anoplocephala perfoliata]